MVEMASLNIVIRDKIFQCFQDITYYKDALLAYLTSLTKDTKT